MTGTPPNSPPSPQPEPPRKPRPGEPGFVPPGGMNCEQCTELLFDLAEGTLQPETKARFDQHISACRPCRTYMIDYARLIRMAAHARDASPPQAPQTVPPGIIEAILQAGSDLNRHP